MSDTDTPVERLKARLAIQDPDFDPWDVAALIAAFERDRELLGSIRGIQPLWLSSGKGEGDPAGEDAALWVMKRRIDDALDNPFGDKP